MMSEWLKNDDKSIRSYILNDVIEKVPIDKSYENLCKVIGNDAIAFYDFQFWYYRFLGGNQDLDFDRSSEPEPLQFSGLPVDAVGLIVDKLKVVERLMLRKVSKPLQEFIKKQDFDCTYISVSCRNNFIRVSYGKGQVIYAKNKEAVELYKLVNYGREALFNYGDHYESEAFNDLAWILKHPKLQIYSFEFSHMVPCHKDGEVSKFFNKFELVLKSLKHQISVRWLELRPEHPDNVIAILPHLKPGYLERITIVSEGRIDGWRSDENVRKVDRIMQLDQWKQANELVLLDSLYLFPDEILVQFKKYWIHTLTLNRSQLDRIRMMFATSPIFEYCYLSVNQPSYDYDLDFIGVPGPAAEGYHSVRHYMIPNTDKLLVFKELRTGKIVIEKKTRDVQ